MNEKKNLQNIFQEFSQIQEKNQWMMVYQVVLSDACWLEHVFKTPNVSFTQKIKDASDAEAKKQNYTTSESKKAQNRRLNR
jgi:hypothetical protein